MKLKFLIKKFKFIILNIINIHNQRLSFIKIYSNEIFVVGVQRHLWRAAGNSSHFFWKTLEHKKNERREGKPFVLHPVSHVPYTHTHTHTHQSLLFTHMRHMAEPRTTRPFWALACTSVTWLVSMVTPVGIWMWIERESHLSINKSYLNINLFKFI